jgi:hypothetical protein
MPWLGSRAALRPRLLSHSRPPFPSRRVLIFKVSTFWFGLHTTYSLLSLFEPRYLLTRPVVPCRDNSRQGSEDQSGILHRRRSQPCFHFTSLGSLPLLTLSRAFHTPLQSLNQEPQLSGKAYPFFPIKKLWRISAAPKRVAAACVHTYVGISTPGQPTLFFDPDTNGYFVPLCLREEGRLSVGLLVEVKGEQSADYLWFSLLSNTQWECSPQPVNLNNTAFLSD